MIFTARHFASAVYTVRVVCLFVRLSVTSRYSIETVERIELVWTWRFFPAILYTELSGNPSGTLSQTLDFEHFASRRRQVDRLSTELVDGRAC